jgi:fatty-acyl-CoA synthase
VALLDRLVADAQLAAEFTRMLACVRRVRPHAEISFADFVDAQVTRAPEQPALVSDAGSLRWCDLDAAANRVARWARRQGLERGDVVALSMENRPEYIVSWLGLARIGVVTALQNTHLRGERLAHCLREAAPRHWIVGGELADACASALPHLEAPPALWRSGAVAGGSEALAGAADLDAALADVSGAPLGPRPRAGLRAADDLFYIYTSGTTGLPKAAHFSHLRGILTAQAARCAMRLEPRDRVYVPLPLYHTAGGVMAAGGALVAGATLVIPPRFSASRFWSDCVRHEVTAFQYIGELCRYLLNAPEHPDERRHRVRVCMGNGLRAEVWPRFQRRFRIPRIVEFYGATEGNVVLVNFEGRVGSIGRLPGWLRRLGGIELLRFDVGRQEVVRGPDGHCIRCEPGEVGEAVGRITALARFEGYTNAEATERKLLRNVFRNGDAYFRTGDLMRRDAGDWFTFVDRIGDTFRWKGENVSTGEVAQVLGTLPGVLESNVYGVEVPGAEGRAGMAALVVGPGFDLDALAGRVDAELAAYARPLFLRILGEMDLTATFKQRKVDLVRQGFDPAAIPDPLYFRNPEKNRYVPLDPELYERIAAGDIRV